MRRSTENSLRPRSARSALLALSSTHAVPHASAAASDPRSRKARVSARVLRHSDRKHLRRSPHGRRGDRMCERFTRSTNSVCDPNKRSHRVSKESARIRTGSGRLLSLASEKYAGAITNRSTRGILGRLIISDCRTGRDRCTSPLLLAAPTREGHRPLFRRRGDLAGLGP